MGKRLTRFAACLLISCMLSACQLLPEEEVLPAIPVISSYEGVEYKMATVQRGDMVLNKTVSCKYVPAKKESLKFTLGGLYIDKVYAVEGQAVKAGQLLAELEQENIQEQIANQQYQLEVMYLKREHLLEDRELDLLKHDIVLNDLKYEFENVHGLRNEVLQKQIEKRELSRLETDMEYAEQMQNLDDSIYIMELQLEEMQENLRERQIIAGIDGIVTYAVEVKNGDRSVKDKNMFTVSDMDTVVFTVEGEDAALFPVGTQVILNCQKKEFVAYAADPSELGLVPDEEKQMAYLKLNQPDPTLEDGDKGHINIVMDERKDVLYVVTSAIRKANDQEFVYMLGEDGLRTMQEVTTGMVSGEYVEIINGLEEGDNVIIE